MAASTLFSIPMILVFFFAQNAFTKGIVTTGIKG
jgi:ABC-type glycerol-3-phosphate transport system permease component